MARKDWFDSKKGLFSSVQQQGTHTSNSSSSRQTPRKPPLPAKPPSSAPSRIPSLKKLSDLKKCSSRSLNLPVLNLEKVRRNIMDQAELASYSSSGGGATLCTETSKVHSARFSTDKHRTEKKSFLSGSLTERGMRDLLADRRVAASGSLTTRSTQSFDRKSGVSGAITDRSCRESLAGSTYAISLSNYLRTGRDSPTRSSKESPFSTPPTISKLKADERLMAKLKAEERLMAKMKADERLGSSRVHSDSRKGRIDKAKYTSSISISNYLPSNNSSLNSSLYSRNCRSDSISTPKHSSLVCRSFLTSRESSDSKGVSELRSLHGFDSSRSSTAKTDLGSWDSKRLPLQLVNTLEEALAGVNRSSEVKKSSHIHAFSAKDSTVSRSTPKFSVAKASAQMDKYKVRDVRHSQDDVTTDELCTTRRSTSKSMENSQAENNVMKESVKLPSRSYKVSPLKLSLGSTQMTVPLGFGGNPAENVQTSRPSQTYEEDGASRAAYTDRGSLRKSTLSAPIQKREKTVPANTPSHSLSSSMTSEMAIKQYGNRLTEYEHTEIKSYPDVYFVGPECQKVQPSSSPGACNYGYDDERGDYTIIERDHIAYRFEILGILGKGSFGQVVKCQDHKHKVLRAVKLVRNKKRFHQQALIEVKILHHLRDKAEEEATSYNVVTIHESFYFRGHLCISFSLHDISLYELIKRNNFQGISLVVIKSFATQLLTTLKFLRRLHVIHCDLKPENILLQHPSMSKIKVIDFGSSCFDNERIYTYIQSRFYRSPEVILGIAYDTMIDIWSFGCILAELYTGYPLFPGENEVEQLACMMEVLGVPPRSVLDQATRRKQFFDSNYNPRIVPNSWGKKHWPGTKDLASVTACKDTLFINFLECCLRWDKNQRASPDELLQHPWILGDSSVSTLRTPLRTSNIDTSKRRALKSSETPPRSLKQSKPLTSSVSKSISQANLTSASKSGQVVDCPTSLPPIGEPGTLKDLQQKKKSS